MGTHLSSRKTRSQNRGYVSSGSGIRQPVNAIAPPPPSLPLCLLGEIRLSKVSVRCVLLWILRGPVLPPVLSSPLAFLLLFPVKGFLGCWFCAVLCANTASPCSRYGLRKQCERKSMGVTRYTGGLRAGLSDYELLFYFYFFLSPTRCV